MVVGKVMRWSPWAPAAARKKKYMLIIRATRLDGLPLVGSDPRMVAAVEVASRGPPRSSRLPYLGSRRRKKQRSRFSAEAVVGATGTAQWADDLVLETVSVIDDGNCSAPWDVSFSVLYGGQDLKEKKLVKIGTITVNLADWIGAFLSQVQGGDVAENKSLLQVQRKEIPITLRKDGLTSHGMLHVMFSFTEMNASRETSETQTQGDLLAIGKKESEQRRAGDRSKTHNSEAVDLSHLLRLAEEEDKVVTYGRRNCATPNANANSNTSSSRGSRSSSAGSSPELQFGSASKRGFFSWGRSRRNSVKDSNDKEAAVRGMQTCFSQDNASMDDIMKELSPQHQEEVPIGTWVNKEFISRDKQTKLNAQTFFASIDQRDESADGESACTTLVAVIANTIHSNGLNTLTSMDFDSLIREGSSEWRKLCEDASYIGRFPNKHFDLETVLEAKIKPVSVLPEKSYIGFFQPESFESLRGAMSFDAIWNDITKDVGEGHPKVYIVSWNDHFFVLKIEADVCYIIDTLGERLYEGCKKAYMLRFDDSTEMHRLPESSSGTQVEDELICSGKECCREFVKRFLAAIPLKEELELEEKGKGTKGTALHQRLQIEFHLTQRSIQIKSDRYINDWSFLGCNDGCSSAQRVAVH